MNEQEDIKKPCEDIRLMLCKMKEKRAFKECEVNGKTELCSSVIAFGNHFLFRINDDRAEFFKKDFSKEWQPIEEIANIDDMLLYQLASLYNNHGNSIIKCVKRSNRKLAWKKFINNIKSRLHYGK